MQECKPAMSTTEYTRQGRSRIDSALRARMMVNRDQHALQPNGAIPMGDKAFRPLRDKQGYLPGGTRQRFGHRFLYPLDRFLELMGRKHYEIHGVSFEEVQHRKHWIPIHCNNLFNEKPRLFKDVFS